MKILSIIAQKPSSTGSGVYLSELVRCFKEMGHEQEIICAVYEGDYVGAKHREPHYNKIIFNTKDLPIKIAGMSDVMPYESMRYSDLASDEKKLSLWMGAFDKKIREVVERFKPDLIICHHLYLLTAMVAKIVAHIVRDAVGTDTIRPIAGANVAHIVRGDEGSQCFATTIYGICHNTDLRQYQQTDLKRDFIKENIQKLDKLFFPSKEHAEKAVELFNLDRSKIEIIGIGYNNKIFKNERNAEHIVRGDDGRMVSAPTSMSGDDGRMAYASTYRLLYVGKVAKKKGVLSLIKAINILDDENIILDIVGGAGDKDEYDEIITESKKSKSKINFIPPMNQDRLAIEYNNHDTFILPSFSEGIPMVPLEAMACGCKVVISDLPGVKNFYDANAKNSSIKYVELPKLTNVDDASDEELTAFEKRLASAIRESIDDKKIYNPDLSNISWENIAAHIVRGDEGSRCFAPTLADDIRPYSKRRPYVGG